MYICIFFFIEKNPVIKVYFCGSRIRTYAHEFKAHCLTSWLYRKRAASVGLEPTTRWLTAICSTN